MGARTLEQKARHAAYMKAYYAANPEKKAAWLKWHKKYKTEHPDLSYLRRDRLNSKRLLSARRREINEFYIRAKSMPCADCSIQYAPWIMQFDHRDTTNKLATVSLMVKNGLSLELIKAEIEKCDVVCANCHAARTHNRRKS